MVSAETMILYYATIPSGMRNVESGAQKAAPAKAAPAAAAKPQETKKEEKPAPAPAAPKKEEEELDLFGSDDENDAEYEAELKRRVEEAKAAKAAAGGKEKEKVIAKSSLLIDVKPWDDETPMDKLEAAVREITMEGLLWGTSKLVAVGYGIKKLQISAVVVDDLCSVDELEEKIVGIEDYVQSMDVAAFNKI
eukprot:TRINITY_DN30_c0_g2_i1.p1 TRINITY_DN30_c0_g2~~TRINITY_DN30_c0_g2_i1.p1  ORF type:complete len:193 (+),score=123.60 TRINITY_DN30_c0_g2_i1:57-635(+)